MLELQLEQLKQIELDILSNLADAKSQVIPASLFRKD